MERVVIVARVRDATDSAAAASSCTDVGTGHHATLHVLERVAVRLWCSTIRTRLQLQHTLETEFLVSDLRVSCRNALLPQCVASGDLAP